MRGTNRELTQLLPDQTQSPAFRGISRLVGDQE